MSLVKNQKTFVKSIIIIIDRKFIFKNVSSLVYLKRGHYVDCQDTSKVSLIFGKTPDLFGLTLTSIRNKRVPLIRSKLQSFKARTTCQNFMMALFKLSTSYLIRLTRTQNDVLHNRSSIFI